MIFNLTLIIICITLFLFEKADSSFIKKRSIIKDKDINLISKILNIIE